MNKAYVVLTDRRTFAVAPMMETAFITAYLTTDYDARPTRCVFYEIKMPAPLNWTMVTVRDGAVVAPQGSVIKTVEKPIVLSSELLGRLEAALSRIESMTDRARKEFAEQPDVVATANGKGEH